jgi:hypothetical protein
MTSAPPERGERAAERHAPESPFSARGNDFSSSPAVREILIRVPDRPPERVPILLEINPL